MSLAAPLWLALWALLPAWLWWRRRPGRPPLADTGAARLWRPFSGPVRGTLRSRTPVSPAEWLAWSAVFAASLALAGPQSRQRPAPTALEVWVERLPGAYLPARGAGAPSRLESALAELDRLAREEVRGPAAWLWRSPGMAPFESAGCAEGAAILLAQGPDARPLGNGLADDRPGVLWLLLDPPEPSPRRASFALLSGAAVPGPVAIEEAPAPGQPPRFVDWDGERLAIGAPASPGPVSIDPELPAWLQEFAGLWAASRGVPVRREPGGPSPTLELAVGDPLPAPIRMRWAGFELDAAPASALPSSAAPPAPQAVELIGGTEFRLGPSAAPWAVSGSAGRLAWARADWQPPRGDPARVALGLCRLFDRARAWPRECVPLEQRLGRPRGAAPGELGGAPPAELRSALELALERARAQAPDAPRSWAALPALLATLAGLLAAALWGRSESPG